MSEAFGPRAVLLLLCLKVNFRTSQNYIPVLFQNSSILVARNIALRAEKHWFAIICHLVTVIL